MFFIITNQKTIIITDSNSGLFPDDEEKYGIGVVPMPFFIDGKEYFEGVSITREKFFASLNGGAEVSTSQPSVHTLLETFSEYLTAYRDIVYIPMSSALSGSVMTAKCLASEFNGRVLVADIKRISCSQKLAVLSAARLAREGYSGLYIKETLERSASDASIYIMADTLTYLKKGGRITNSAAAIATVLNIKPVLKIDGDMIDSFAKVRGYSLAQKKMLEALDYDIANRFKGKKVTVFGACSCDDATALMWQNTLRKHYGDETIEVDPLPLSICCHTGPGAIALGCSADI